MITSWDIYWITRLDGINTTLSAAAILGIIAIIVVICFSFIIVEGCMDGEWKTFWKTIIKVLIFIVLFILGSIFVPTTKEMAAIYLLPKIVNNEQVQKIPNNALKLLNEKMEQWINDSLVKKDEKEK